MSSEHPEGPEAQPHIQAELAQALRGLGLASDPADGAAGAGPATVERLPDGAQVDRFSILRWIGGGGQGDVYAAYDPELDRRVALKLIRLSPEHADPVRNNRLMREAQALARLEHPNVVRVHDTGIHGEAAFIVMEFKTSQTLTLWLAAERRRWQDILEQFLAAGRGLRAAHEKGIVHRDVKADNIFVDPHVGAVLGDFGLAFGLDDEAPMHDSERTQSEPRRTSLLHQPLTENGHFPGTEGYIAPEAMTGRASALSDQYSFCVALFHALFGVMARPDERRWPPRPRDTPRPEVVRALHRGLARDPAGRFPDMGGLLAALGARSRRRLWFALGVGLLGVGAGAAAVLNEPDPCIEAAEQRVDEVWNQGRRDRIEAGFRAIGRPFAGTVAASFLDFAEDYAQGWAEARRGTCAAPSEPVAACLDHEIARFDRLLDRYSAPDPDLGLVMHAMDAASRLHEPSDCRDFPELARTDIPDELHRWLEDMEDQIASGDYAGAWKGIDGLRAQASKHPAAHPRALYLEGWLAAASAPDRRSDELLEDAMNAAGIALDDDTYERAATYRVKSLVVDLGELVEAKKLEGTIRSHAAHWRRGMPVELRFRAEFAEARGLRLAASGDPMGAAKEHYTALSWRERVTGVGSLGVAKSYHNLAASFAGAEHYDEAQRYYARALAIRGKLLGADHPQIAETAFGMAHAECEYLGPRTNGDPGVLSDCLDALEAVLTDYAELRMFDPRGLCRRAVTLANMMIKAGLLDRAEALIATAEQTQAGLKNVDPIERSDVIALRGGLANARGQPRAARAAFMEGVDLWEGLGRRGSNYFQHLGFAAAVAVDDGRVEEAVELLLSREQAAFSAPCGARRAYADALDLLISSLGGAPDRRVDELQRAAVEARLDCT